MQTPSKGRPFTLSDLRKFIAEMDDAGATEDSVVTAKLGWTGEIKQLRSTVSRFGDHLKQPQPPRKG